MLVQDARSNGTLKLFENRLDISNLHAAGFLETASSDNASDVIPEHVGQISVKYYYRFPYKYKL